MFMSRKPATTTMTRTMQMVGSTQEELEEQDDENNRMSRNSYDDGGAVEDPCSSSSSLWRDEHNRSMNNCVGDGNGGSGNGVKNPTSSSTNTNSASWRAVALERGHSIRRKAIHKKSMLRYFMFLPEIPGENFVVSPDKPLPNYIVDREYNKLWSDFPIQHPNIIDEDDDDEDDPNTSNTNNTNLRRRRQQRQQQLILEEEQRIRQGIPTPLMARTCEENMRWNTLVQSGACTATYTMDKFILQLTNTTIIAVLLSAFSTTALVATPNFNPQSYHSSGIPTQLLLTFQILYSIFMFLSSIFCFGATAIALHSTNRLSNVQPSKSSASYMTLNIFFAARDAVEAYVFRGMAFACAGMIICVIVNTFNIFYGIPAAIVATFGTIWFIVVYKQWDKMAKFHSDVADKLCAKDFLIASETGTSVTVGLWTA